MDGWDKGGCICSEHVLGEVLFVKCVFVVLGGDCRFVIRLVVYY